MSTIFVVGIGPGAYEIMTIEAADALRNCDVIIGYTVYVDLVKEHFAGKEFLTTPMRKEVERCRLAFETAAEGKQVAMICSGDAGVGIDSENVIPAFRRRAVRSSSGHRPDFYMRLHIARGPFSR